jgi:hypothetical protein
VENRLKWLWTFDIKTTSTKIWMCWSCTAILKQKTCFLCQIWPRFVHKSQNIFISNILIYSIKLND